MNRTGRFLAGVAMIFGLMLWARPHTAVAQEQPTATSIEISAEPALDDKGHKVEGRYTISVVLTDADGRYVDGQAIQVAEIVDFFGRRAARLGTTVTDATGMALVDYQPSEAGQHQIVARFAGDQRYAASDASLTLDAANAVAAFTTKALPLESVGRWLSIVLAILGVVFWAVLLGVVGHAAWRINGAAARHAEALLPSGALSGEEVRSVFEEAAP